MNYISNKQAKKRRIFYTQNKIDYYQIFTFSQENDGSIYCSWPEFQMSKWVQLKIDNNSPYFSTTDTPDSSHKLSLHGSGVVKFRKSDGSFDPERIKGNFLYNNNAKSISARHLFTAFMKEPKSVAKSVFGNRSTDVPIYSFEHTSFVFIFFAIPQQKNALKIQFQPSFNIDLFDEKFENRIGCSSFALAKHDILWFAYKTKYMEKWPKHNYIFYHDGFMVPVFIGQDLDNTDQIGKLIVTLQQPEYSLIGNNFTLKLQFPEPEDINFVRFR